MTEPQPPQQQPQPVYTTAPPQQVYTVPQPYPQNGLAIAGLVLGIIAMVIAMIPFVGIFFIWPASILAIIFGAIGHSKASQGLSTKKRESIVGWILGITSIVIAPFMFWLFLAIGLGAASTPPVDECPNSPAVVEPCSNVYY